MQKYSTKRHEFGAIHITPASLPEMGQIIDVCVLGKREKQAMRVVGVYPPPPNIIGITASIFFIPVSGRRTVHHAYYYSTADIKGLGDVERASYGNAYHAHIADKLEFRGSAQFRRALCNYFQQAVTA